MDESWDIAVVGGGSAGICAAVAAAREGARTLLIERSGIPGGMGTLAKVHTFCGLYNPDVSKPPVIANPGLPGEIEKAMREATGSGPVRMGRVYVLPQDPDTFRRIALKLIENERGLRFLNKAAVSGIRHGEGEGFFIETERGEFRVRALIDASADARVAEFLGIGRESAGAMSQRPAFIFSMKGVKPGGASDVFRMRMALEIVRGVKGGALPDEMFGCAARESVVAGEVYFTIDLEENDAGRVLKKGNALARMFSEFLRANFPEYAAATGPYPAAVAGIRETFRWRGRYVLTGEDLKTGKVFPDTVAWATWPMELRETVKGPKMIYFDNAEPAGIPLGALASADIPGVFFAGRCISAAHEALASVRVMGTCFATGQAAGRAAAGHVRKPAIPGSH